MSNSDSLDYSIRTLFYYLIRRWVYLLGIPFLISVGTAMWTLSLPNVYRSEALVAPSQNQSGELSSVTGQLGGLASMAGISLGGKGAVDKVSLALETLTSRSFLLNFIKENELEVVLIAGEYWDDRERELVINKEIYDVETRTWLREVEPPRSSTPTDSELYESFLEQLVVEKDPTSGVITISVESLSPLLSKEWLEGLVTEVNKVMRDRELSRLKGNISYLKQQVSQTEDVEIKTSLFGLIQEQYKELMLANVGDEYVLSVISEAYVPDSKYGPRRALIVFLAAFLSGGIVACFLTIGFVTRKQGTK
ncbi:hypothetical protein HMF8227_00747 [Saliniradius amylolyticus]|uniref:Polysaccharide chain length determinant N-terminal domain-containing protein n=1 Tax=Saliniradius amylolyticus TaxID=2183582 RepID=A0A2S2E0U8_9ALTE|nr:Wzz/FepE/Etk N-terminal domain-containing protein [Saliniradius amylolyticus]AWL11243.1 hypothetical protein HMF8227_00747 [Saliniradius amylolyticus]